MKYKMICDSLSDACMYKACLLRTTQTHKV